MNNGDGEKTVIRTLDVTTDAKAVPDIQVTSPSKSKNSISFSVSESDTDGVGSIVRVELLRDNNTVAALEGEVSGEFINLLSGTAYTVRATYVYDLNNGEGEKTVVRILDVTTDAEPVPTINFTDYKNNGTSFSFVLSIADNPDICEILSIKMFDGDNEIATGEMGDRVEIPIPTSRKEYTVKVTYRYDLNDGAGPHTEVATISTWAPTLGLEVDNGYITGIGSCADKIIFIDKPIASDAFNGNINIEEVYILGESIGNNAFYGCIRLKYVHLADGVEILSREAFHDCVSLERINFPSGLEELGEYAFENCIGLKDIIIDPNTKINGIGDRTFIGCTSLESIFIPDSVTFIDYMAFRDCYNLKTVIFGENSRVSRIGEGAFIDCKSLESFRFPSNVIVIEKDVFSGCTSMQEVIISDEILTIKTNAFRECNALKEILIPSSVLLVESEAFIGCDSLIILVENSEIPEGWHPEWNPDGCTVAIGARINEYEFETNGGSSVDSISDYAILFSPVSRKDGFILEGWYDNPELSGSTVEFPYYSTEGTKLYAKWIELDIPNESTGLIIENGVVVGLGSCTDTVLYINKPIGELAFYDCNDIETIYLGEGVTSIGDSAFNTCDNLTTVIFISDIKPALGSDVFGGSWDNRYFGAYAPYESYDYFYNCSCEYWQEYLVGAGKLKAY
ncbi:MAG: leucine-rich repeat protein [Clostridia bacterium]|nr:leucine-rich repeat protein [Clostridia bacterium]